MIPDMLNFVPSQQEEHAVTVPAIGEGVEVPTITPNEGFLNPATSETMTPTLSTVAATAVDSAVPTGKAFTMPVSPVSGEAINRANQNPLELTDNNLHRADNWSAAFQLAA